MMAIVFIFAITISSCEQTRKPQETKDYSSFLLEIQKKKSEFNKEYVNADSLTRIKIIDNARKYIFNTITDNLFPYWYGTTWDFNGTTRTPKKGSIACGFFVTTILKDAGFNIPRIKWAQSASEPVIIKLAKEDIKRFSGKPISDVEKYLKKKGDGLYVVGLDCHIGFIVVNNEKIKFVHSNYFHPDIGVMSEDIDTENPLNNSGYRIIGKLLSDEMIIHWITDTAYE